MQPKSNTDDAEVGDSSPEIEVIHEKGVPKLQSILKQRTISESSDEIFSSSFSRENSITSHNSSESPISESDENFDGERKKSVSFCDHVDKTTYKTASSVSSMRATLKNKRRRARKREQKQEKSRRRRHGSGGSEVSSSGDELSGQQDESEGTTSADTTDEHGDDDSEMLEAQITHSEEPRTKQYEAPNKRDTHSVPSKKGDSVRTKSNKKLKNGEAGQQNGDCNGSVPQAVPSSDPSDLVSLKPASVDASSSYDDYDDDDDGDDDSDTVSVSKMISQVSINDSQGNLGSVENRTEGIDGNATDSMLSWKDNGSCLDAERNEHITKCAFDFTNTMIYDLDED